MSTTLTWLGHSAFRVDTPSGKRIYVDPFLNGNPKCPENEKEPERVDAIFITHGHNDHVGDTLELAKKFECPVVAPVELRDYLSMVGVREADGAHDPNKGGTVDVDGIKVTLVHAQHSSSFMTEAPAGSATEWQIVYTGEPCGLVFDFGEGPKLYFAGDTNVFGDMALIARLYAPDVAILPIGGHFTMDPKEAAVACELLGVKRCVPCHYGTFPILAGTPDAAARAGARRRGDRTRARAGRWSCEGALVRRDGRRVPELALEGSLELEGALVLDDVVDLARLQRGACAGDAGRRPSGDAGGGQGGARAARGRIGARADREAAGARPDRAHLWLGRSRRTRSPPATSRAGSGESRRSRSSSPSARSCPGPSRVPARSRRRPTRTLATGRTGSRCCGRASRPRRSYGA